MNTAPVLAAIGNQSINELATLSFTATATDAYLPADTFSWSFTSRPAGSTAALSDPAAVAPTFVVDVSGAGDYLVQLIVNDGTVDSAPDTVTISAP